ncbi:MAG: alpha/beta hydrolase family protein [Cytophagaceae bacterium]
MKFVILLIIMTITTFSCKDKESETIIPVKPQEARIDFYSEISAQQMKSMVSGYGFGSVAYKIKHDVRVGKITYTTTFNGKPVNASGLIFIPKVTGSTLPVFCFNHGTTFRKSDAPSVKQEITGAEFIASSGYITIMPDYLGYGASADIFHPYYDAKHSASVVIDAINATQEYAAKNNISSSKRVFMAGYSEGGYVTLAAQKYIEANSKINWDLVAVAAGAGGYDLTHMLSTLTAEDYFSYPAYLAFLTQAYNLTYGWNKPLNHFFSDKYASALEGNMDGSKDGGYINNLLTTDLTDLFEPTFYSQLKAGKGNGFLEALQKNSLTDFAPKAPLRFYHGTNDEVIPLSNSQVTMEKLKTNGGTNISLKVIQGGNHGSSFVPMAGDFIPWFEGLK